MAGYSGTPRAPGVTVDNNCAGNVGPGAGEEGGKIVVNGTPEEVLKRGKTSSYTSKYLKACLS
jgi:excinuclease UvrABC ATPase subunit